MARKFIHPFIASQLKVFPPHLPFDYFDAIRNSASCVRDGHAREIVLFDFPVFAHESVHGVFFFDAVGAFIHHIIAIFASKIAHLFPRLAIPPARVHVGESVWNGAT
jgi:hypothetical protein